MESPVIIHLLLNYRGLLGRDALTEFFTVEEGLENKVRAALAGLTRRGFEELLAEGTAAQTIDRLQILENTFPFLA